MTNMRITFLFSDIQKSEHDTRVVKRIKQYDKTQRGGGEGGGRADCRSVCWAGDTGAETGGGGARHLNLDEELSRQWEGLKAEPRGGIRLSW